jgi:hypothetical protein
VTSFVLASFPVLLALTLGLGAWMTRTIEHQVTGNSAANLTFYMQSVLSDDLQSLACALELTPAEIERIKRWLSDTPLGEPVASLMVWKEGGRVAYASPGELIGQAFNAQAGSFNPVPLPASVWLMLSVVGGLALVRRRL